MCIKIKTTSLFRRSKRYSVKEAIALRRYYKKYLKLKKCKTSYLKLLLFKFSNMENMMPFNKQFFLIAIGFLTLISSIFLAMLANITENMDLIGTTYLYITMIFVFIFEFVILIVHLSYLIESSKSQYLKKEIISNILKNRKVAVDIG